MAAEKTNPMNAASQDPGKVFLMSYLGKKVNDVQDLVLPDIDLLSSHIQDHGAR